MSCLKLEIEHSFFIPRNTASKRIKHKMDLNEMISLGQGSQWIMYSWYMDRDSPIYEFVNGFILECHQHGIIAFLDKIVYDKNEYIEQIIVQYYLPLPELVRKSLDLETLSAGFYLWLMGIIIATITLFGEKIVSFLEIRRRLKAEIVEIHNLCGD